MRILLACCGVLACGRTPTLPEVIIPAEGPGADVRVIPITSADTFRARRRLVIRDSATWEAEIVSAMPKGALAPPRMNFAKEIAIVVATRTFSGTGPFIQIDSVRLQGEELTAYVRTGSCAGPSFGGQMMTTPISAIAAPRKYSQIRFVESYETEPGCLVKLPDTTA